MSFQCPHCILPQATASELRMCFKAGSYWRKSDGRRIQRFFCKRCQKHFSGATGNRCFAQKKRHKNQLVRKLMNGGVSQREAARITGLNRKTIVRKLLFWAQESEAKLHQQNAAHPRANEVEFDDLETFEHTKCKPLSVTLMVEAKTRRILGFEVSRMPAKGRLAAISFRKYGPRPDERALGRDRLFERVRPWVEDEGRIRSDSNPHYVKDVRRHFPQAKYETVLGGRGAVTGQGELKKLKFDPIFSLNHTCAMLRSHLSRLIRQTWCTTKKIERLRAHLYVYALAHNERLRNSR